MSLINFKLKQPADITPWGGVGWFVLSDGEYWIDLGKVNFYEVTEAAKKEFGLDTERKYVDYNLARLIEDFSELFERISEPVPIDFYELAKTENTLFDFWSGVTEKIDDLTDDNISEDEFFRIHKVREWISDRTLTASHLKYGPRICFFRFGDRISLVWDASTTTENGNRVWTAGKGSIELAYENFVQEIEAFKEQIFSAMETQIQIANSMDWGNFQVDKSRRLTEQAERKEEFEARIKFLSGVSKSSQTKWDEIRQIQKELSI